MLRSAGELDDHDEPLVRPRLLSKLDTERNFLALYLHSMGEGETPLQWHYWSAISVLSASVMNRVWVETYDHRKIRPNFYIILIGESGGGKSYAIGEASDLAADAGLPDVFHGRATREFIIDRMGKWSQDSQGNQIPPNPNLYFINDELASSLRPGEHGLNFLTMMTELFSRPKQPWSDGTRGSGLVQIADPCINWLAGTTDEWLKDTIPPHALEGGLMSRILWIRGAKDFKKKYPRVHHPPDYDLVRGHLVRRLAGYTWLEGIFKYSTDAEAHRCDWYMSLPDDPDDAEKPMLNRADTFVQRLSLIYALAELEVEPGQPWNGRWMMTRNHLDMAIESWQWMFQASPQTVNLSKRDPGVERMELVRRTIRRLKRVGHSVLMQRVSPKGIRKKELKEIIENLRDHEEVLERWERTEAGREAPFYYWVGGDHGEESQISSTVE